nr:unnamed protein product [Spirometra erinaceieuropaei]
MDNRIGVAEMRLRLKHRGRPKDETRFSEQGQLEEVGADYTFFWSGRPKAKRRDAGVAFAIRNDIVGRLPCLLQDTNNRLRSLRLSVREENSHHRQRLRSHDDPPGHPK